jgi:hypothetical protein
MNGRSKKDANSFDRAVEIKKDANFISSLVPETPKATTLQCPAQTTSPNRQESHQMQD